MRIYLDCYPCYLNQALRASRLVGADEEQQKRVLERVLDELKDLNLGRTPPEIGARVHEIVRDELDVEDPYREVKEHSTKEALSLLPRLEGVLDDSDDELDTAIRLSIAGNIIDFAPNHEYVLWETVERVLDQPFAIDDRDPFHQALSEAERVLYLADNAGETVFDRVLIERLDRPVTYAVKGAPILNDATREDAEAAGIDEVAEIVSNGSRGPGTILSECSPSFRERFERAEIVIAKGQANYETLSDAGPSVFFLLQIKCAVIGEDIGAPQGSIVLKQG